MTTYSLDLRRKIIQAYERGLGPQLEVAEFFWREPSLSPPRRRATWSSWTDRQPEALARQLLLKLAGEGKA